MKEKCAHAAQRCRDTDSILKIVVSLNLNHPAPGLARFKRYYNLDTTLRAHHVHLRYLPRATIIRTHCGVLILARQKRRECYRTDGDNAGVRASFRCLLRFPPSASEHVPTGKRASNIYLTQYGRSGERNEEVDGLV